MNTPLKDQLIADMRARNLPKETQERYIIEVADNTGQADQKVSRLGRARRIDRVSA